MSGEQSFGTERDPVERQCQKDCTASDRPALRVKQGMHRPRKTPNPFRYFHSSPEVIRLVVRMYVRFPLSLRNVEDLLFERG